MSYDVLVVGFGVVLDLMVMSMLMSVRVCVCVCVEKRARRVRDGKRDFETWKEKKKDR